MTPALAKSYSPPPTRVREVLRYARSGEGDAAALALLPAVIGEAEPHLSYRVAYRESPVRVAGDTVELLGLSVTSHRLATALAPCRRALLFAATVGTALDRLIARYARLAPSRALLLSALGTERVEALCDLFCRETAAEYGTPLPRLSPGYGDLPLSLQRELLPLLDAERHLGITLSPSLLMSPTKSVTAFVGILD
ncbi:MAG: Vitamin B12 dependent methionine synthase activation subunit [Clostridia bacterium]|nr:Vitamin B12 dependent methionine synthase activation subunit [Clostridia bacterium]